MYIIDNLFYDIRTILSSIVIKYEKEGKELETVGTQRESDLFISASLEQDSFNTYQSFPIDVIEASGETDLNIIKQYNINKSNIPTSKRENIVKQMRKKIVNEYIEKNDYYRKLNGKPPYALSVDKYIYLTAAQYTKYNVPVGTPIHEINKDTISILENDGVLDKIKATQLNEYPYLDYLGTKSIDIIRARTTKNFGILRMTSSIDENIFKSFNTTYEMCREYFMSVIYVKEFGRLYDYFDNFIALSIMIMTIQRLTASLIKDVINRDFYDLGTIELFFNSYNVPFFRDLPLEYQKVLVRNLNQLLRYKSTEKVLYDICSLLGLERIKIFKYFLVKEHKLDVNDNPIFSYKTITDDEGNQVVVEDKESMYDLYFQSVELKERNTSLALLDNSKKLDYNQVVVEDPYWWNDADLNDFLYDSEFNFVESKYLNMNVMYKMSEMIFENIYVFRMLIDKKNEISHLTMTLPKLFLEKEINLFNIVCFLCALMSKKNGFVGNILSTPSKISSILGFDFNEDIEAIKLSISTNPNLDQKLLNYLGNSYITSADDVNRLFAQIKNFNDSLIYNMNNTNDIKVYQAYKKIFDTMLVTTETTAAFVKSDGTVATTYLEYLRDVDNELYNFVVNTTSEDISTSMDHVIAQLDKSIYELKYTYMLNDTNNIVVNTVVSLVNFFKSYTTDLTSFNVIYLFDSRYYNMVRAIGDVKIITKLIDVYDNQKLNYSDIVLTQSLIHLTKENLYFKMIETIKTNFYFNDKINVENLIKLVNSLSYVVEPNIIEKVKVLIEKTNSEKCIIHTEESVKYNFFITEKEVLKEKIIETLTKEILSISKLNLNYSDTIKLSKDQQIKTADIYTKDRIYMFYET